MNKLSSLPQTALRSSHIYSWLSALLLEEVQVMKCKPFPEHLADEFDKLRVGTDLYIKTNFWYFH